MNENNKIKFTQLPRVLSKLEKRIVIVLIAAAITGTAWWGYDYYIKSTQKVPKKGGVYTEGFVGQPKFVNPIIAQANTVDMDITELVYSSLIKYDANNNIVLDLAESYEISEDAKEFTIRLKKNLKWHDGEPFKADDVIYTVQSIQNQSLQSSLKSNFDKTTAEKIDDDTVKFSLKEPYSPFITNLTFGILPKHIWELIEPANIPLAELNLQPIGTGPYKFKEFQKNKIGEIKTYTLELNEDYYRDKPYIEKVNLNFYQTKEELAAALEDKKIDGLAYDSETQEIVETMEWLNKYAMKLPRYNAVFINYGNNEDLEFKKVREALQKAIDKKDLTDKTFNGKVDIVNEPILENFTGYNPELKTFEYNLSESNDILHNAGWNEVDENGYRKKEGKILEFTLSVSDFEEHVNVAKYLQEKWKEIGVKINIETFSPADIQEKIRQREYDMILFGQVTGHDPDPYPFWHSSQRQEPGLNLTSMKDEDIDKLLEQARETADKDTRAEKYKDFQEKLTDNAVAIFLYSPRYLYAISDKIKGLDEGLITKPSERFSEINKWYIKTKREKNSNFER